MTMQPEVFAVIPVYNRIQFTRTCVECLKSQTYPRLHIVVVDGGSNDDTVNLLRREHPDVTVLHGNGVLWWTGAMRLGIEYALARSCDERDMVLMMNNDTLFGPDYVGTLVRISLAEQAAVGALTVDSRDPTRILEAGVLINWPSYSFVANNTVEPAETFVEADVLPGRGTLVPLQMIRAAGNVDDEMFPHYIADYEFFSRLRRHGFRLGATCQTMIQTHVEETGLHVGASRDLTFRQAWKMLFSIKSQHRVRDHWRFIDRCAPAELQRRLKRLLIWRSVLLALSTTKLRHVVFPLAWWLAGPYYITEDDCRRDGLSAQALVKDKILAPWLKSGWYEFAQPRQEWWPIRPDVRRLYLRAWNPLTKINRWRKAKAHRRSVSLRQGAKEMRA